MASELTKLKYRESAEDELYMKLTWKNKHSFDIRMDEIVSICLDSLVEQKETGGKIAEGKNKQLLFDLLRISVVPYLNIDQPKQLLEQKAPSNSNVNGAYVMVRMVLQESLTPFLVVRT